MALADTALVLNKLNTFAEASVKVKVTVSAFPESSDTIIDFIIPVVDAGTVYITVSPLVVRSFLAFVNTLATYKPGHSFLLLFDFI